MPRLLEIEPLAGKIGTVARLIDGSPTTAKRLVKEGVLPPPFQLTPKGVPLWWMPDVKTRLADRADRSLAA